MLNENRNYIEKRINLKMERDLRLDFGCNIFANPPFFAYSTFQTISVFEIKVRFVQKQYTLTKYFFAEIKLRI